MLSQSVLQNMDCQFLRRLTGYSRWWRFLFSPFFLHSFLSRLGLLIFSFGGERCCRFIWPERIGGLLDRVGLIRDIISLKYGADEGEWFAQTIRGRYRVGI